MSIEITFELSDQDIEHFIAMAHDAAEAVNPATESDKIIAATREMLIEASAKETPEFISSRLDKLGQLVNMVEDDEWKLEGGDLERVLRAIAYFANPEDLIPDRVPGLGFLDDAIMIELVVGDLEAEIDSFAEFCAFRSAEEDRRKNQGLDTHVSREDWLADQRAVLQHRMRKRRRSRGLF
ncbi:MAG: YkvA family protein [Gammaproteobacteria bacterium]